jgi:mannosylglycerate synthase
VSLVVFPFKDEPTDAVASNFKVATEHDDVDEVWGISADEGPTAKELAAIADTITDASGVPVRIYPQERIGRLRPGKGDAMNTAIRLAAEQDRQRVHFYDADITNFDGSWIEGAERAADRGFGVVRHRFPRASTDAMITWFVTRPGLAILFPGTFLPRLNQPLGGELLLTGAAVEQLASDSFVKDRSDWGIDTVLTHAVSTMDLGLYEHHVADGKRHALYGSLDELRTMLLECVDAVASLSGQEGPSSGTRYESDADQPVPEDLKKLIGYDLAATTSLTTVALTDAERDVLRLFPKGAPSSIDSDDWFEVVQVLLERFDLNHEGWRDLTFRLWLIRVLSYTTTQALAGFDSAMVYLERTIVEYEKR